MLIFSVSTKNISLEGTFLSKKYEDYQRLLGKKV